MLKETTVFWNGGGYVGNFAAQLEGHTYWNSKYYEGWRDKQFSKNLDDFQTALDVVGTIPLFGEPVDLLNAGISYFRGDYTGAALSVAAMVPIGGWLATGSKFARKEFKILKYQERVLNATDRFHNFPVLLDAEIIKHGAWSQRIKDGADMFMMPGTAGFPEKQYEGFYEIGINQENEIFHRSFIPGNK